MATEWYVGRGNDVTGPVTFEQLAARARLGRLRRDDRLCAVGSSNWQTAGQMAQLWSGATAVSSGPAGAIPSTSHSDGNFSFAAITGGLTWRFVKAHWNGDLPLAFAYWGVGFLLQAVLLGLGYGVKVFLHASHPGSIITGLTLFLVLAFSCVCTVWQLVGVWRSAGRSMESSGSLFPIFARIAVMAGALRLAISFNSFFAPMLQESALLAVGIDTTPAYHLALSQSGKVLELSGGMPFGTAQAVRQQLADHPEIKLLKLESQGGRIGEAMEIYTLLHDNALSTWTEKGCASACTIAFLGGRARYLSPDGKLGYHSASFGGVDKSQIGGINDEIKQLMRDAGIPDDFIAKATAASAASIWIPSTDELVEAGIVTKVLEPSKE